MSPLPLFAVAIVLAPLAPLAALAAPGRGAEAPTYERDIAPLLREHCQRCHGGEGREGGLDMSTAARLRAGGESGPALRGGRLSESLLWRRIADNEMPPEEGRRLPPEHRERIRRWIEAGAAFAEPPAAVSVTEHDVIPILLLRCAACHGATKQEGGLDVRSRESLLRGGKSGPVVKIGEPESSPLLQRARRGEMPPPRDLVSVSVKPMTPGEQATLERWIRQGLAAGSPDSPVEEAPVAPLADPAAGPLWSLQPPRAAAPPSARRSEQVRTPIDAFILARLEPLELGLSPEADRATVLRRLTFDLLGLPPTPRQLDAFLSDTRPDAYERLVDRLLASPRYGERWGRHWLDAAGYADSEGAQNEDRIREHMYRYRDYVIRAYNSDKPYDRQLLEQLAGDELADYRGAEEIDQTLYDNLVATGFLRTAPDRTFANITNFVPDRLGVIAEEIQILGSSVLGLTLHCARCHAHKFDPISQRDYFRLAALLKDAYDEHDWLMSDGGRTLPHVTTEERRAWERHQAAIEARAAPLRKQLEAAMGEAKSKLEKAIQEIEAGRLPEPRIRALWSRGRPSPTYLLLRGNYLTPGPLIAPGAPTALSDPDVPLVIEPPYPNAASTGRRLALARWVVSPRNPLTARVLVNRVWKHHFGQGLVRTLDNFGAAGEPPSHPELLDYLAVELVRSGWSLKQLHRSLVCSSAYRQSSRADARRERLDPDLRLLSRMPLRRLDAEALRDTLLTAAGLLVDEPFGPGDPIDVRGDGLATPRPRGGGWRRSIYILHRRTTTATLLESFDYPTMGPNCIRRSESIVAPQALHLMNNGAVRGWAERLAARARAAEASPDRQLDLVWQWSIGTPPAAAEREALQNSFAALQAGWEAALAKIEDPALRRAEAASRALTNICHSLFNSAALLYVD